MTSAGQAAAPSVAPLLQIEQLTLRFGGLTAVSAVDLQVQPGEIAAVIGPNGAGKTSLFNAITGIYEPTSGTVRLGGQDMVARLTGAQLAQQLLAGLALGVLALLMAAGLDGLWAATIKQQNPQEFSIAQALSDGISYLQAQPRVEARMGRFMAVSFDGQIPLGSAPTREKAQQLRDDVARGLEKGPPYANPQLPQIAAAAATARIVRWLALVVGALLGAAGTHAVWRRQRRTPTSVARLGVARTFQNIRLFHNMTVLENVLVAMDRHLSHSLPWWHASRRGLFLQLSVIIAFLVVLTASTRAMPAADVGVVGSFALLGFLLSSAALLVQVGRRKAFSPADLQLEQLARSKAMELLAFVGLDARAGDLSRNLPYGDQRRLEIARALATEPRLLLLDEPAAGMNPSESVALMQLIRQIKGRGVTVLLIEHHMRVVMGISDRITVLVHGKRIAEGTPEEIRNNPKVIEAYLGTEADAHG